MVSEHLMPRSYFELCIDEQQELLDTITRVTQPGKGIYMADSCVALHGNKIGTPFGNYDLEDSEENRRRYHQLLFTTPNISKQAISLVTIDDEIFRQVSDNGQRMVDVLRRQNIQVAIEVSLGTTPLVPKANPPLVEELMTCGTHNLAERLSEYKKGWCSLAKWRSIYHIFDEQTPSELALIQNSMQLGRFCMFSQRAGLVPVLELRIINGRKSGSILNVQMATERILASAVKALADHHVLIEATIFLITMITSENSDEMASANLTAIRRTLPPAIPMIGFLCEDQTSMEATNNLNAINQIGGETGTPNKPWQLTFSFGAELETNVLEIWRGSGENAAAAQKAFMHRCKANSEAEQGTYENEEMVAAALSSFHMFALNGPRRYY